MIEELNSRFSHRTPLLHLLPLLPASVWRAVPIFSVNVVVISPRVVQAVSRHFVPIGPRSAVLAITIASFDGGRGRRRRRWGAAAPSARGTLFPGRPRPRGWLGGLLPFAASTGTFSVGHGAAELSSNGRQQTFLQQVFVVPYAEDTAEIAH